MQMKGIDRQQTTNVQSVPWQCNSPQCSPWFFMLRFSLKFMSYGMEYSSREPKTGHLKKQKL